MAEIKGLIRGLLSVCISIILLGSLPSPSRGAAAPQAGRLAVVHPHLKPAVAAPSAARDVVFTSDVITDTLEVYLPLIQKPSPNVCGDILTDTVWKAAYSPYHVTCDVIVAAGATLTIEAGALVQFQHSEDDLIITGTLHAVGTESAPTRLQASNGPTPGGWGRVAFLAGSSGVLDHTVLEYGGSSSGMLYIASDAVQVLNSVVQYSANTGIYIQAASPLISANQILSNTCSSYGYGGGLANDSGSPTIQNNTFTGNTAYYGGGLYNDSGNPLINSNTFTANKSNSTGGGLFSMNGSPTIQNNLFSGNSAIGEYDSGSGGGLGASGSPIIQNNTFTGNLAAYGGGLYSDNGIYNDHPIIRGNILVNNTASNSGGGIYVLYGTPALDYNDVWNNTAGDYSGVAPGAHDISTDPLLIDSGHGDFHLAAGSPCIDAGAAQPDLYPATDFDGDPRPMGMAPDMGVDEFRTLGVVKISTPQEAAPGAPVTYTIKITNLGAYTLTNVLLTDTLPVETAFTGYQANGLACEHNGAAWGGQLTCTPDSLSLTPGESRELIVTVNLTETFSMFQYVNNYVTVTALAGMESYRAQYTAHTWVTWCLARLNDILVGGGLQAAIDASTQGTDLIKVSGYCPVQDLHLSKNLTLQGGWNLYFSERDSLVYTTTLDGQTKGRVMLLEGDVSPTVEGFMITGGKVSGSGGGISILSGSPTIQDNLLTGNSANSGGGISISSGNPTFQNNNLIGNSADSGGGLSNGSGSPRIQNNTFIRNGSDAGGGLYNDSGAPTIQNNTFTCNWADSGGGLYNRAGDPTIQENTFTCNSAYSGGGLYNFTGTAKIQDNSFFDNDAMYGAGIYNSSGSPLIQNNIVSGNIAYGWYTKEYNDAGRGGGLFLNGSPIIQNNTIYGNTADGYYDGGIGGGIFSYGTPVIRGNIVANNEANNGGGGIYGTSPALEYNDVWNNAGGDYYGVTAGAHDISADPLLVDPDIGDFHISSRSPGIDAGHPTDYPPTDFEGDSRPAGPFSDIGADEYRGLRVVKTGAPAEAMPGASVVYSVVLSNLATFDLSNVLLTDDLPDVMAFAGYQADGLTCVHDGSVWGGRLSCTPDDLSLPPEEIRTLTVNVTLNPLTPAPQYITNTVTATASASGDSYTVQDWTRTRAIWCAVQLNDTPLGGDLQAAIDASTQPTDVVKVSGYCSAHNLLLNKTLTLQGGWSRDFSEWDPAVHTTTLDGQKLVGRLILVEGLVNPMIEGFVITGGNVSGSGGGISITSGSPTIQDNTFIDNDAILNGGAIWNGSGSPLIQNNIFSRNIAIATYSSGSGGGLYNDSGSPTIRYNTFTGNSTHRLDNQGFGGGVANNSGSPIILRNIFTGNSSYWGGALYNGSGSPLIQNNIFTSNFAVYSGAGIYTSSGSPIIHYNTFSGNNANYYGGGLYIQSGSPIIRSNIVVNNTAGNGGGISSTGTPVLTYNDVWNNTGGDYNGVAPGEHDISADPFMVDPFQGDIHLTSGSPCIDAGDPVTYPPMDFEGDPRPQGLAPDIGADEY